MRTVIDRSIMAQATRGAGLRSNHFGLRSAMGSYHTIGFEDTMNDPYEQPDMMQDNCNAHCEKIYGLWTESVFCVSTWTQDFEDFSQKRVSQSLKMWD